jgi:multidrug resistance protein, MATE family
MLLNAIKENIKLTFPILLTRLLGITSNLIAMILIAKLGTEALSASALIMGVFSVCVLLVMSFSFSVCAVIAEACGSHTDDRVGAIIISSIFLNTLIAIPFMLFFYYISPILIWINQPPQVAYLVGLYFHGMIIGYLPMIWASILEQFFIGIGKPRYIVYLSIISLFVMPLLSYLFMFGKGWFPALGMLGAGYAVSIMAVSSLLYLLAIVVTKRWHKKYNLFTLDRKLDFSLVKKLYYLGWPIAFQFAGEFIAYTFITIMMGWLGVIALAAQQVILQFTTVIVMIPTSVSQATAVLVGQARGRHDEKLISYHVNIALAIVSILMGIVALIYLSIPEILIRIYLVIDHPKNTSILTLTTTLLAITALSQCFDGVRNVLAGAYRGLQETKTPMLMGTMTLWLISLPLAYYLGFVLHQGAIGVRWGFTIGIICGTGLLALCWYANINVIRLIVPKLFKNSVIAKDG